MYIQVIFDGDLRKFAEIIFFAIQKEILSAQDLPKCSQRICLGLKMNELGLTCLFFFLVHCYQRK